MTNNLNNWNAKIISLLDKRIHELKTEPLELYQREIQRELELLNNLKSVVEISSKDSFVYQRDKLEKIIEILNKRYDNWLNGDAERKGNPNSRTIYNTEVGLNHLRRQRRILPIF